MDNELKEYIKQSIREAIHEIPLLPHVERGHENYPMEYTMHLFEHRLHKGTDELGFQIERLSMLV